MQSYRLSKDAENDLLGIWRYTRDNWGEEQADLYFSGLEGICEQIGKGQPLLVRSMVEVHEDLRYCLHERHYVFWLEQMEQSNLVVAFLHDRMDIVQHLAGRANDDFQ